MQGGLVKQGHLVPDILAIVAIVIVIAIVREGERESSGVEFSNALIAHSSACFPLTLTFSIGAKLDRLTRRDS